MKKINRFQTCWKKDFSNSLFVGEAWHPLIGYQGRFERRLFIYMFKEYMV
ncbi:hypothetical protein [Brevibacillus sp. H7]